MPGYAEGEAAGAGELAGKVSGVRGLLGCQGAAVQDAVLQMLRAFRFAALPGHGKPWVQPRHISDSEKRPGCEVWIGAALSAGR
ncbi:hypothetical protein Sgleb_67480 [Streptomyces glebosus]|uniref:Uncharacterized protein n=1 Tax=Streptomyces glebosus TaxID=249580 RepID=A0A640T8B2_9ACTN|nr:hypothetical protein Sgleb_67480 [Streptomyces glebosus]GHG50032.1 hypothetical protein GCM10010513_08520 [Streptomyces glebosus]